MTPKTILITGATDGIGLETARLLVADGHRVLVHGRSAAKLEAVREKLTEGPGVVETFRADLARLDEVEALARAVAAAHTRLDVLINNAGVLRTDTPTAPDGRDVRFIVNTIAPYLLTRRLLPCMGPTGRVVNLSSAAQAPVDLGALTGPASMEAMAAYSQSKLAITAWSRELAQSLGSDGPVVVSVNPGSLLASKMVREGFGIAGNDIGIGARILVRAATDDAFASASGAYFDNDAGAFADPHPDALDPKKGAALMKVLDSLVV
ncbi:MAG: SDR family NAD(P)-dependent oxidoreductase [Pseudomonadota bacterium]